MSRLSSVFEQGMSAAQPITGLPQQMAQMVGSMPQQFAQPVMSALQQVTSMTGSSFGNGAGPGNWAMSPPTGAGPVGAQFGPSGPGTGAGGGGGIGAGLRTPGAWSSAGGGAGAGSSPSVSSQTAEETGASKFGAARGANAAAGGSGGGPAMMAPLARRNKRDEAAQRSPAWAAAEDILYREPEHVPVVWGGSGAQPHRGGEE